MGYAAPAAQRLRSAPMAMDFALRTVRTLPGICGRVTGSLADEAPRSDDGVSAVTAWEPVA